MKVILDDIVKAFGSVTAVDHVSIDIGDGEFVALLGPSGCGKTTTLLMIAGIYRPTSGAIRFGDRVVNHLLPKDRNIGMVFQSYALYPHMTVYDNITFPLSLQRVPKDEMKRRAQKVADLMQIGELLGRKPGQLSGGQQQRVALCRALVKEPDVLLFDEPLSNLDARLRLLARSEIKRLQKDLGKTAIFVTHDQIEALTMADRIALMSKGKLVAYAPPDELYHRPPNRFAAEFIGSPPMNFLEVEVQQQDGRTRLVSEGVAIEVSGEMAGRLGAAGARRRLVLGVRPEDVAVNGQPGDARAEVYIAEPMGRDVLVDLHLPGGQDMRALAPSTFDAKIGDQVGLTLDRNKIHLFEPESGRAII